MHRQTDTQTERFREAQRHRGQVNTEGSSKGYVETMKTHTIVTQEKKTERDTYRHRDKHIQTDAQTGRRIHRCIARHTNGHTQAERHRQ